MAGAAARAGVSMVTPTQANAIICGVFDPPALPGIPAVPSPLSLAPNVKQTQNDGTNATQIMQT